MSANGHDIGDCRGARVESCDRSVHVIDGATEVQRLVVVQDGVGTCRVRRVAVRGAGLKDSVAWGAGVCVSEHVVVAKDVSSAGGVEEATECAGGLRWKELV